jgi:RNA polymerase sigma factor (sigma-70 family)
MNASEPTPPTDGPQLEYLLARALPTLKRVAAGLMCGRLRQRCSTSDLVQSAMLDAIRCYPAYAGKHESEFVGWTLRILERNTADRLRRLRAAKRDLGRDTDGSRFEELQEDAATPAVVAGDRERLAQVVRALRHLDRKQRRVLRMVAVHGRSHAEVAALLGCSEGACRVLLTRARAALLVAIARAGGHDG